MTAECCIDFIMKRLEDFGLILLEHVVGMVTDGASVMIKTGRLFGIIHQICHFHEVHLVVCDVLYKTCRNIESTNEAQAHENDYDMFESSDDENDDESLGKLPCQMIKMQILLIQ